MRLGSLLKTVILFMVIFWRKHTIEYKVAQENAMKTIAESMESGTPLPILLSYLNTTLSMILTGCNRDLPLKGGVLGIRPYCE
jgi:hypothetical protein